MKSYCQKSWSTAYFLIILILFMPFETFAGADPEEVVYATVEWMPYESKNLKHYGLANHIVKEAFEESGYKVRFEFLPWKRALLASSSGEYDAGPIWGGYKSWEATHIGSDYLFAGEYVLWQLKDTNINWKNETELKDAVICQNRGDTLPRVLENAFKKNVFKVIYVDSTEQGLKTLLLGRAQFFISNYDNGKINIQKYIPKENRNNIIRHPDPLRISLYRTLFGKNGKRTSELREAFNAGLYKLKQKGLIMKYRKDFLDGKYEQK